ncbi:hypothetical protein HHI36_016716 [Cryptolaemus montrouzieri]|uniref:Uncharacterized protein n=1 Tax=Cryptolaemus montrouzieri TaxID=559131 RepID=A0ABD2NKI1_9CUCU
MYRIEFDGQDHLEEYEGDYDSQGSGVTHNPLRDNISRNKNESMREVAPKQLYDFKEQPIQVTLSKYLQMRFDYEVSNIDEDTSLDVEHDYTETEAGFLEKLTFSEESDNSLKDPSNEADASLSKTYESSIIGEIEIHQETHQKDLFSQYFENFTNLRDHSAREKGLGGITNADERGRHENHAKVPEFVKRSLRDHIAKFHIPQTHCSHERSRRNYLDCHLNISRMFQKYRSEREQLKGY